MTRMRRAAKKIQARQTARDGSASELGPPDRTLCAEASFAEELGRDFTNIVGRCHDEHGFVFVLEPTQERAQNPGGCAAFGGAAALRAAKVFFNLGHPQHTRRDGLGGLDDGS